jgi:tetratricopeptide (TPR) repeat protein
MGVFVLVLLGIVACGRDPETAKRKYFKSGEEYAAQKNYSAAVIQYRNAIQQDPRFGEARYKLAIAYAQTGDLKNSLYESVRAADLLPDRPEIQLHAAGLLLLARRFPDARARAEEVLKRDPKNVQAQVALGNALAGMKDLTGAVKEIEEALRLAPDRSATYASLGALQAARGDLVAAESAFREAVTRDPQSVVVRLSLAHFYWLTGRTTEAERVMKEALAIAPTDAVANRVMALFYQSTNRVSEAEPYLKAVADATGTPQNRLALADYYLGADREADAQPILQSLASDPSVGTAARLRQAAIDQRQGHGDAAEKTIDEILVKEPRNVQGLLAKAQLLVARRSLDEALTRIDQAITADPSSASAQFARGRVLLAKHQLDEAKTAFNETLKLNPRAAAAQVELARLHLQAGAAETSVALASEALKTDPRSGDARLVLARALMARGDLNQAETLLKELLAGAPQSAVVHAQMGLLHAVRNNRAAAAAEFKTALDINPLQLEAIGGQVALDLAQKNINGARQRVDELVGRAPTNAGALTLAARIHVLTDDATGAEALLIKAIAADPSALPAYGLLGQVYVRESKLDQARTQFVMLADRQSKPVAALTMVGIIDQARGRTEDAQRTFERVLQVDSRAAVAANNLAWIYCENGGNLDVALQLAQTAKGSLPNQAEVDDTLGWIYYRKELVPLAITALQRSVDRDPKNALAQYHLGLAYYKAGDKVRAKGALQAALRLQPNFEGSAEANRIVASL